MSEISGLLIEEMPRERLVLNGPDSLTNVELLALILGSGTKKKNVLEISREILKEFNFSMISRKSYEELLNFEGISKANACKIVSVFEISRRIFLNFNINKNNNKNNNNDFNSSNSLKNLNLNLENKVYLNSSQNIYDFVKFRFSNLNFEKVMLILVNSKNKVIKSEFIFEGSINFSLIDNRKIIKRCLIYDASGFFLIHNHPSGDFNPSDEDILVTKNLKKLSDELNLRFLDHLILGDGYFSLYDNDLV